MPNEHLLARLGGIQAALMAHHQGGAGLPNAMIGNEREVFISEFLQKVFPPHHRFSTGAVTDARGRISGQTDIAVEYGFLPSFPMPGGGQQRLLLAESIAVTIEVKSNLSVQWNEVKNTVRQLRAIERNFGSSVGFNVSAMPTPRIPCIAVGYTGYATLDGITERLSTTPEDERPDGVLCIESGMYRSANSYGVGLAGLYVLIIEINQYVRGISHIQPDLGSYLLN